MDISLKEFIEMVGTDRIRYGEYIGIVDNGEAVIQLGCSVDFKTREVMFEDDSKNMLVLTRIGKTKECMKIYKGDKENQTVHYVEFNIVPKSKLKENDFVLWREEV